MSVRIDEQDPGGGESAEASRRCGHDMTRERQKSSESGFPLSALHAHVCLYSASASASRRLFNGGALLDVTRFIMV
jgi:hypothetical protein